MQTEKRKGRQDCIAWVRAATQIREAPRRQSARGAKADTCRCLFPIRRIGQHGRFRDKGVHGAVFIDLFDDAV